MNADKIKTAIENILFFLLNFYRRSSAFIGG